MRGRNYLKTTLLLAGLSGLLVLAGRAFGPTGMTIALGFAALIVFFSGASALVLGQFVRFAAPLPMAAIAVGVAVLGLALAAAVGVFLISARILRIRELDALVSLARRPRTP